MKKIELTLTGHEAAIANDPVYIEAGEDVEFVIINPIGKLYFSTGDENVEIKGNRFIISYNQLKEIERLSIVVKTDDALYPKIYPVVGLKIHDVTILGRTIDEKYPDVIQDIYNELNTLKRAVIELYDLYQKKEEEGVIE